MREIKFRAWMNGKLYQPALVLSPEFELDSETVERTKLADKLGWALMQYTGLKDKNGKEIYEGDLVWHSRLDLEHPLKVNIGGYWPTEGDCGWGVHVHNDDETFVEGVSAFNQDHNLEVIGNIYEHPELLTNTN